MNGKLIALFGIISLAALCSAIPSESDEDIWSIYAETEDDGNESEDDGNETEDDGNEDSADIQRK